MAFDAVVTAEHVGSYKPAHAHFTRFAESFDVTRDRWVHVAQGYVVDMEPASQLDIPRVWINRLDEPHDPAIAHVVRPDLDDLVTAVETAHAATRQSGT